MKKKKTLKDAPILVRLERRMRLELTRRAAELDLSVGTVVRGLIRDFLGAK